MKVNGETLNIKEKRKLMNRILIASRNRPEIDLSDIFGKHEFSVVPLSLFAPMAHCTSRSSNLVFLQNSGNLLQMKIISKMKQTAKVGRL